MAPAGARSEGFEGGCRGLYQADPPVRDFAMDSDPPRRARLLVYQCHGLHGGDRRCRRRVSVPDDIEPGSGAGTPAIGVRNGLRVRRLDAPRFGGFAWDDVLPLRLLP